MKMGYANPKGKAGTGKMRVTAGSGATNASPSDAGGNGTKFNADPKMPNSTVSGKGSNHWQAKPTY